jgi:HEAT repeat protein
MDCENAINESLASLDIAQERVQAFLAADEACVARLVSLSDECSASMIRIARDLLQHARRDNNEYKLQVLLRALFQRKHPQTIELVMEALGAPDASDKEAYLTFLLEFDDPRVVPMLVDFVASLPVTADDEEGEDENWMLVKAIDALRYYRVERATPILLLRLDDHAGRVRRAVIDFLVELDVKSAAPSLALRLDREDDPDNMKALVGALVGWNYVAALPRLRRMLEEGACNDDEPLRKVMSAAVAALAATSN